MPIRLFVPTSLAALAALGPAALLVGSALAQQPVPATAQSASVDVGPPPTISDTSAMDPELVELLNERVAAVEADPSSVKARTELGFAYEANTMWSLAEVAYSQAVALAPEELQWRFRRGVVRFSIGDIEGSLDDLKAAADAYKNTPVVQARLGDVLRFVGELEQSEAAWRQAIAAEAKQPQNIEYAPSRVGLAQVLLDLGELEEAEALCRRALELQPGYRQAHYTLGLALRDQGRADEAAPELVAGETAFKSFPPDPHQKELGDAARGFSRRMMMIENLMQAGNFPEAKARLDAIRAERPDDHMVLNLASRVAQRQGDMAASLELLNKSLEVAPGEPSTLMDLCLLKLREAETSMAQLGQMQGAQQQGQAIDQAQFEALRAAGEGHAKGAVDFATQALQAAPAVGRHHYWLGVSQSIAARLASDGQVQGQLMQAALGSMQNAARLGCTEPGFNQQIAALFGQMGRPRESLDYATRHLLANPKNPMALQQVIQAQVQAGEQENMRPYVERLRVAAAGNPEFLQFAVKAYLTIRDADATESVLSDFEAAAAGNPQAAAFITAVQAEIAKVRAEDQQKAGDKPVTPPVTPPKEGDGQ